RFRACGCRSCLLRWTFVDSVVPGETCRHQSLLTGETLDRIIRNPLDGGSFCQKRSSIASTWRICLWWAVPHRVVKRKMERIFGCRLAESTPEKKRGRVDSDDPRTITRLAISANNSVNSAG